MNFVIDVEGFDVWKGSSLFFGGLNLARQIRRWRHARLVDLDRYDADCESESFGWDDDEEEFIELCRDAGETAWYRRHSWEVVFRETGEKYYDGRFDRKMAKELILRRPDLTVRRIG